MTAPTRGSSQEVIRLIALVLSVAAIAAVSTWIMAPFLPAITWAATIALATWPVLVRLQARLGGRRWAAATVLTLILALGTGLLSVVLGVPLAWAAARSNVPLRRSIHALVALSYITPPYLTALAYIILLGPDAGYFNRALRWLLDLEAGPFNVFSMGGIIFVIGIQPPNQWALYITVGFFILTAIVWLLFENRRFKGPPIGDLIAERQAIIAAAEKAVGER